MELNITGSDEPTRFAHTFEEFKWEIRVPLIIVTSLVLCWDIVAVAIIIKTKRTPENTRFLSKALMIFDVAILLCRILPNVVPTVDAKDAIMLAGTTFLTLNFFTLALMAAERNLMFCSFRKFLKFSQPHVFRKFCSVVWLTVCLLYPLVRTLSCMSGRLECLIRIKKIFSGFLIFLLLLCFLCYLHLFLVVRTKKEVLRVVQQSEQATKGNRNTKLCFSFLVTTTVSLSVLAIDLIVKPAKTWSYLSYDIAMVFNGIVDPFLYIFWFRESRMVILKAITRVFGSKYLVNRVEAMRIDIFNIVTSVEKRRCDSGNHRNFDETTL